MSTRWLARAGSSRLDGLGGSPSHRERHTLVISVLFALRLVIARWLPATMPLPAVFTSLNSIATFGANLVGVGMVAGQHVKAPQFHMFYGFVAIIAVGIIYSYRQQLRHRIYLLYGGGGLFIMGLGIRALLVGKR